MSDRKISDLERTNKAVMIAHAMNSIVICIFCVLQVFDGREKPIFAISVLLLGLIPVICEFIFWRQNHESSMIKHFVGYGFAVFYTYILFTATNHLVFAFAIPMILAISIYNDNAYSLKINAGLLLENLLVVILGAKNHKFGYVDSDTAIIQIVICILIMVYSVLIASTSAKNNQSKLENVVNAQKKTEKLLHNISSLSGEMQQGIESVYQDLEQLKESSEFTKNIMGEVSLGIEDTAQNAQKQLLQTEAIRDKVAIVNRATEQIGSSMKHTFQVLEEGRKDIDLLVHQVDESVKNGANVAEKLNALDSYMAEMYSIVAMISNITTQTELLSLNASIEAARAGEAGKGFAVVASEISSMAIQTSGATEDIIRLISNVSAAISEVVSVIRHMIEGINEEKASTIHTEESFQAIERNTFNIHENVDYLMDGVEKLQEANRVIMESVQTVSAISEEVSAHAARTMEAQETNESILDKISVQMNATIEMINREEEE